LRFYDPQSGSIRLDGVDLREADPQQVRARMALVAQDAPLFSGSALDNIRYGREEASIDAIPRSSASFDTSRRVTSQPPTAATWAMPDPIRPEPTTISRPAIALLLQG
jgi:ATP-binding cassette subfamily B protein